MVRIFFPHHYFSIGMFKKKLLWILRAKHRHLYQKHHTYNYAYVHTNKMKMNKKKKKFHQTII